MTALQITLFPCHADGCKSVSLGRDFVRVIRNYARGGKGEFVAEMLFPYSEGLSLEVAQGCLNRSVNHLFECQITFPTVL